MSLTSFLWQSSLTSPALSEPTNLPTTTTIPLIPVRPLLSHYFLTPWPFSNAPPLLSPTHPPSSGTQTLPTHSSCLNSFGPSLFQSLTQKAQTQMMNKKLTIRLNAIQVDP